MKIAVIAATGRCGRESTRMALEMGWQVVAVVRNPDKMVKFTHEKLEVGSGCSFLCLGNCKE